MCGRFTLLTFEQVAEVIEILNRGANSESQPALRWPDSETHARPGDSAVAVVVVEGEDGLVPATMTWGFDVSWSKNLVFNTRIERAYDSYGMWTDSFASGRCIVPARAFFEPHRDQTERNPKTGRPMKSQYAFASEGSAYLLMAGVSQGDRFSVVTTVPDAVVDPIHDRMPLLLDAANASQWLGREYRDVTAARIPLSATKEIQLGGQLSLL